MKRKSGARARWRAWVQLTCLAAIGICVVPAQARNTASETQRAIERLEVEIEQRRAFKIARGRALVRLMRAGLLPLSGGFDLMTEHASRIDRLRHAIRGDDERLRQLQLEIARLRRQAQQLASFSPQQEKELARARSAIAAAREREDAFRRAFESGRSSNDTTAVYGAQSKGAAAPSAVPRSFDALRGRLQLPVAGRVEVSPVKSHADGGRAARLTVAAGAIVRALASGRVAFAGDYPELGQTVIVDHGDDYYSVLSSLSALSVRAGDELAEGTPMGTAGYHDGRGRVVVELRHRTKALDTPAWLGL